MLVKTIVVFLGLMVVVGLIGRALFPSVMPGILRKDRMSGKCAKCGRHLIGQQTCDCARGRK